MGIDDVTVVVVNWKTPHLVEACVARLLFFYPTIQLVITDNDSRDRSTKWIAKIARAQDNVSAIMNRGHVHARVRLDALPLLAIHHFTPFGPAIGFAPGDEGITFQEKVLRGLWADGNIGHGPGLHQAFMLVKTRYALALDSDCRIQRRGFIEGMLEPFADESVYAVGRVINLSSRGGRHTSGKGGRHIHPSVSLLDVEKYKTLLPYVLFGVPTILNMPDANRNGYEVVNFPVGMDSSAVYHPFAGSRKLLDRGIPKLRSKPFLPEVFLLGLKTEYLGGYFKD